MLTVIIATILVTLCIISMFRIAFRKDPGTLETVLLFGVIQLFLFIAVILPAFSK